MKPGANHLTVLAARTLAGVLMATVVLLSPADATLAQTQDEQWKVNLEEAQQHAVAGRTQDAIRLYYKAADMSPTDQKRAEILVELGILYDRQASDLDGSAMAFSDAMKLATGELRLQAANNFAAQLLRLDRPDEAVDLMRGVWSEFRNTKLDPIARSRSLYNYARALERVRQMETAQEYYQQAHQADPDFGPAERAVLRFALASSSESIGIPELLGLTTGLLKRGDFDAASRYLKEGLTTDHWKLNEGYPRLVTQLVQYFTAARTTPEQYQRDWQQDLGTLVHPIEPRAAQHLWDIELAYIETLPVTFQPLTARGNFSTWDAPGEPETLSAFLKMVGDHHFRTGVLDKALERYSNAWALDTTNMEAGLYLANLLTAEADQIDPDGGYLEEFLSVAFEEKARAYLGEDWSNILKFHTVLGTLFERLEVWGPDTTIRTAAFQWKHALQAHAKLAEQDPQIPRAVPAIRQNLARAYMRNGETVRAWGQYMTAAEEYYKLGRVDGASSILEVVGAFDYTPTVLEQERLERLREILGEVIPIPA